MYKTIELCQNLHISQVAEFSIMITRVVTESISGSLVPLAMFLLALCISQHIFSYDSSNARNLEVANKQQVKAFPRYIKHTIHVCIE